MAGFLLSAAGRGDPPPALVAQGDRSGTPVVAPGPRLTAARPCRANNWSLNVDLKKVWVDVDVAVGALGTVVTTNVDVDPWLIGVGIGYRF